MNPNLPSIEQIRAQMAAQMQPQQPEEVSGRGGFLTSLISEGGAAGGAALGTAFLPGIGTILGAGLGGLFGRLGENKVRDDKFKLSSALGEAALSAGTASIAPLFRGAKAAKAAAGSGDDVLKAFGSGFSSMPGTGAAAAKLADAGDETALKTFKLNRSQIQNIRKATGKDPASIVKKFKLVGKSVDDVQLQLDDLNKQFGNLIDDIGDVTVGDVRKNIAREAQKYLSNPVPELRRVGQEILDEGDALLANLGDDATKIGSRALNNIKGDFDGLTNWKTIFNNPTLAGKQPVNKALGGALRETLRSKSGSNALKNLGVDIRDLTQFAEEAAKQADLGRGTLAIGLTDLLAAGGGASVGSLPGAVGAVAAKRAVNSPLTQNMLSRGLTGAGNALAAVPAGASMFGSQLAGQLASRIPGQVTGGLQSQPNQTQSMPMSSPNNIANNMGGSLPPAYGLGQGATALGSAMGMMPQMYNPANEIYPQQNLMADIERDPANAMKYIEYYATLQEVFAPQVPEGSDLTATQQQQATNALSGLQAIDVIESQIGNLGKTAIPGGGLFGGLGDRLLGTGELETAIKEASDVITRLRTGAAINANEERFYRSQLPQAFDSPEVVAQKLGQLRNLFLNFTDPSRAQQQIAAYTGGI